MAKKGIKQAREELKLAFGFALGAGIFSLFALQSYFNFAELGSINREPIWAIAFVPLGPMLIYLLYGFVQEKHHQDTRGFADSAYYFGFILTLTSLVLATFFERLNDPDVTLSYFGAALTTTLLGIAWRTYHTQFLYEKEDDFLPKGERERVVHTIDDFVLGVTGLSHQLDVMAESIRDKLTINIDSLSETISDTNAPFHSLKEGLSDHIDGITAPFKEAMENVGEELKNANEPITDAMNVVAFELRNAPEPVKESVRRLSEQIEDSSLPIKDSVFALASELKGVSQPLIDSINDINEKLNSEDIYVDLTEINKLTRALNTLNNKFPGMITKLEETSDKMIILSEDATKEYLKLLRKLNENNRKAVEKLKEFEDKLKETEQQRTGFFSGWFGRQDDQED